MSYFKNVPYYLPNQLGYKDSKLNYKNYIIDTRHILSGYISEIFEINNTNLIKMISVIPDGCNDIIITYDKNNISSYLSPSIEKIQNFSFSNEYKILGIRFLPGATSSILQEDMCNILGYTLKINYFLKDFYKVEEVIIKSKSFEQRCNIIISYFEQKLKKDGKQLLVDYSINKIILSKGNYLIENLSQETGYSTRYIRNLFKSYVGHSPKELSNIIRIQNMLNYMLSPSSDNLATIALNCGFSDQSHMNRQCKRYLNTTVGNIYSNQNWFNDLFTKSQRTFY